MAVGLILSLLVACPRAPAVPQSSLKLLCMQPEAWVPRAYCMSNCLAVVGQRDDPASKIAISALAHALHAQKLVAMVRYVTPRSISAVH